MCSLSPRGDHLGALRSAKLPSPTFMGSAPLQEKQVKCTGPSTPSLTLESKGQMISCPGSQLGRITSCGAAAGPAVSCQDEVSGTWAALSPLQEASM